ncbi:MAG: phosphatidylserine decarboxylase family protein [candidate division Zixibacteria bacterium]|nr:phosphatidylserine decarboxylase family protein [candidate division Zixibacteria bacterium]
MIAKEGLPFVISSFILTSFLFFSWYFSDNIWLLSAALFATVLTLYMALFFRDPNREIPEGTDILVSPADGFVVGISEISDHHFLNAPAIQVSIFLTIFDVHINRIPISGVVEYVNYKTGKFLSAFKEEASEANEQSEVGLITESGIKIAFKQIAGLIARRIICKLKKGQSCATGERYGLIRFGSRADLILPLGTKIEIKKGQHVKGGVTIIGRLPSAAAN